MRIISKGQQCIFSGDFIILECPNTVPYLGKYLDTGSLHFYHLYFMDLQAMGANVKMAETMGATSKVMANMNKMMNPQQVKVKIMESGGDKKYENEFLA